MNGGLRGAGLYNALRAGDLLTTRPFFYFKMVQIAHAIRALACISFRYIVGPASLSRPRLPVPRLPVVKPVPTFFGEPGLYLSDTFSLTQSRLACERWVSL